MCGKTMSISFQRHRNTNLRGGHLTKYKGSIASVAPFFGVVVLIGLIGGQAHAACTPSGNNTSQTINCTGPVTAVMPGGGNDTVILDDTFISTPNPVMGDWIAGSALATMQYGDDNLIARDGSIVNLFIGGDSNLYFSRSGPLGDDIITIEDGADVGAGSFLGITGDVNIARVATRFGDDIIRLEGGTIHAHIHGDATSIVSGSTGGNDQIILDGTATVDASIFGDIGNDMILLTRGTVTGNVDWGEGDEGQILDLEDVTLGGSLIFGAGRDVFTLTGGTVGQSVHFGNGANYTSDADTFTFSGGMINLNVAGDQGDDVFNWTGGTIGIGFFGQNGSDTALVSAAEYDGTQILDGGDDFSAADGFIDELTLQDLTLAATGANITNWESVVVDGGTVSFLDDILVTGSDAGTGLRATGGGTIDAGSTFALTGNLTTDAAGTFQGFGAGTGSYSVSGSLANNGTVTTQDGSVGDTITVAGNYSGTGLFLVDVDFSTNSSDVLVVGGDVTGGATAIGAQDVTGGIANGEDVLVVDVEGSTSDGDFVLANGPLVNGAFVYELELKGSDWFLVASAFSPPVPVYEVVPHVVGGLNQLPSLQERVGNRHWVGQPEPTYIFCKDPEQDFRCLVTQEQADVYAETSSTPSLIEENGAWIRVEAAREDINPVASTTGASTEVKSAGIQVGIDKLLKTTDDGKLIGGVNLRYVTAGGDVSSAFGLGSVDAKGYGIGGTLTWYDNDGFYVDGQIQAMKFESDISSNTLGKLADGTGGFGYALSVEAGKKLALNDTWTITPQAQLTYAHTELDSFTDPRGNRVSFSDVDSLKFRLGVMANNEEEWTEDDGTTSRRQVHVGVSLIKEFKPETSATVAGTVLTSEREDLTGEIVLGGSYNWEDDKYSVYGEVAASTGLRNFGDSRRVRGTVGFRTQWQ